MWYDTFECLIIAGQSAMDLPVHNLHNTVYQVLCLYFLYLITNCWTGLPVANLVCEIIPVNFHPRLFIKVKICVFRFIVPDHCENHSICLFSALFFFFFSLYVLCFRPDHIGRKINGQVLQLTRMHKEI